MNTSTTILFCLILLLFGRTEQHADLNLIEFDNPHIVYSGRFAFSDSAAWCSWPGSSIKFRFKGTSFRPLLSSDTKGDSSESNYVNIFVDGKLIAIVNAGLKQEVLIDSLSDGIHEVEIYKRTEALFGKLYFSGLYLSDTSVVLPYNGPDLPNIEFIGNSITCGYGNEGPDQHCPFSAETENQYLSYAAIATRSLNAEAHYIAYSGKGILWNYNKAPSETMPRLYERLDPDAPAGPENTYDLSEWSPDLFVINLGTNDFSHDVPDSTVWVQTYVTLLEKLYSRNSQAKFILVLSPMMSDSWPPENKARSVLRDYLTSICFEFRTIHPASEIQLMEMSQQGQLGFGCDWHPSLAQHQKNAEELIAFIRKHKML